MLKFPGSQGETTVSSSRKKAIGSARKQPSMTRYSETTSLERNRDFEILLSGLIAFHEGQRLGLSSEEGRGEVSIISYSRQRAFGRGQYWKREEVNARESASRYGTAMRYYRPRRSEIPSLFLFHFSLRPSFTLNSVPSPPLQFVFLSFSIPPSLLVTFLRSPPSLSTTFSYSSRSQLLCFHTFP